MTITKADLDNTRAAWTDCVYRYFAGPTSDTAGQTGFQALLAAGITATLSGWSDPDTGAPADWTEITSRVSWRGEFAQRLQGSLVLWEARLEGYDYDADYLSSGLPIVAWRRVWNSESGWQAWAIAFVGQMVRIEQLDDCRAGGQWQRLIVGLQRNLERLNAPRLTAGPIQITLGASVDVKDDDILADPALEKDSGEFVGALANVDAENIVDGRLKTVFISASAPSVTQETLQSVAENGYPVISEVFFAPTPGYSRETAWWVEIFNTRNRDDTKPVVYFGAYSGSGAVYTVKTFECKETLGHGKFGILCGNRAIFEAYTGGAPAAEWVIDVSEYDSSIAPHPTDGFVACETRPNQCVIWAPAGAARSIAGGKGGWHDGAPDYNAEATFDSDLVPAESGYSIRKLLDAGNFVMEGDPAGNASAWFALNEIPSPGSHTANRGGVALRIILPENESYLTQAVGAGVTTVPVSNIMGFVGGQAVVEGDVFSYTGADLTGLTGVTDLAAAHEAGARVYPYVEVAASSFASQTGYPLSALGWQRRKLPTLFAYQMYWSYLAVARQYQEDGWRSDYYSNSITPAGGTALTGGVTLYDPINATPYQWVRTILLVIDAMSDGGRAKLNEVTAELAQLSDDIMLEREDGETINITPLTVGDRSARLAAYLLTGWLGLATADFTDASGATVHQLGPFALAVQPMLTVLNDLARTTGCLAHLTPAGPIYWRDDTHWPLTTAITTTPSVFPGLPWHTQHMARTGGYGLAGESWRGELRFNDTPPDVDYVILNATALGAGGVPVPVRVVYPPPATPANPYATEPPTGAQATELQDYAVAREIDARLVAETEYLKRKYTGALTLTVKGLATWAYPGLLIGVSHDFDGDGGLEFRRYILQETREVRTGEGVNRELSHVWQLSRFRE